MSDLYNINNIPHGTAILTINAVAYKTDDLNISNPTEQLGRKEVTGEDSTDLVVIAGRPTGTATLQLATTTTVIPAAGLTFSHTLRTGASRLYVITEVSVAKTIAGITTCSISFSDVGVGA